MRISGGGCIEMGLRLLRRRGAGCMILLLLLIVLMVALYELLSDLDAPEINRNQPHLLNKINMAMPSLRESNANMINNIDNYSINQTRQYCNSPFEPVTGSEGRGPKGYEIRMLHVFTRHGDRTQMHTLPGFKKPIFDCNFTKWYSEIGTEEKIKTFGEKMKKTFTSGTSIFSGFRGWQTYPDRDTCGIAMLTNLGALQHIKLGQYFYSRYQTLGGLFHQNLTVMSTLRVRSTTTVRTFQSAMAFLYGFLPDFDKSAFILNASSNLYMCISSSKPCDCALTDAHDYLINQFENEATSKSSRLQHNAALKALLQQRHIWQENVMKISHTLDAIAPSLCHNKGAPCSNEYPKSCIDDKIMNLLWEAHASSERLKMLDPDKNLKKSFFLKVYPVLKEISLTTNRNINDKTSSRMFLYSGHDFTLSALLVVLGVYDGIWSPYASRVVLEIYESSYSKGTLYIRVLYNGDDVTSKVSFCQGSSSESMCEFDRLQQFLTSQLVDLFGKNDYHTICEQ